MKRILEMRNGNPCQRCAGAGYYMYGSTATWRGSVGGRAMTEDVCDRCWGSGTESVRWPSHKDAETHRHNNKELMETLLDMIVDHCSTTREGYYSTFGSDVNEGALNLLVQLGILKPASPGIYCLIEI